MQHLLANLDPGGILAPHMQPLIARLNALLGSAENTADEIRRRVLIVGIGKRSMKLAHFENIGSALLRRKRLSIRYYARGRDEESEREMCSSRPWGRTDSAPDVQDAARVIPRSCQLRESAAAWKPTGVLVSR